jgi:aldose 1-epimerase
MVAAQVWNQAVPAPAGSGVSARGPPIHLLGDHDLDSAGVDRLNERLLAWAFGGGSRVFMFQRVYATVLELIAADYLAGDWLDRVLDYEQRRRIQQEDGDFDPLAEQLRREYANAVVAAERDRARQPTGLQFVLRLGDQLVVVTQVGAGLREYRVGGRLVSGVFGATDERRMGQGLLAVPWAGRVIGGTWTWNGKTWQLDLSEPGRGHAIHGLATELVWDVVATTPESITLGVDLGAVPGWPFPMRTEVTYALTEGGLVVTHKVINTGTDLLPFALGPHPYIHAPTGPAGEHAHATVGIPADTVLPVRDTATMVPTGQRQSVAGSDYDLRAGVAVNDLAGKLDDTYTDLTADDEGRVEWPTATAAWSCGPTSRSSGMCRSSPRKTLTSPSPPAV